MEKTVETFSLTKTYSQAEEQILVLDGISFCAREGEFVSIVGPSGCGKSTFLNILGLLDCSYGGEVKLFGQDISRLSEKEKSVLRLKKIGFVFQFDSLLPEFSALENVELPAMLSGKPSLKISIELFKKFNLEKLAAKNPREISGGEKQRIAVLRAIRNSPGLILADEPTGNLDHNNALKVLRDLRQACDRGACVITVTHNEQLAREFSDSIYGLSDEKLHKLK